MPAFAWAILSMVASYALQAIMYKPPAPPTAASLDDFSVPQIDEGTPQAVVFGDGWVTGWQVLWYGNYRTTKIKAPSSSKK